MIRHAPCGKQHLRETPTPDFVRTLRQYPILKGMLDYYMLSSSCELNRKEQKMQSEFYPSQTKILEGGTKDEIMIFAALFNGS
jgi:hypothetical protein